MNQVDFLVIVVIAACAYSGARRGLIHSAGDIISLIFGLIIGALAYPLVTPLIKFLFGSSEVAAETIAFVFTSVLVVAGASWGFSALSSHYELEHKSSRIGGAFFGVFFGLFFAAILVMASGILPGAGKSVESSALAKPIISLVPRLHENLESIGAPLPKLVHLPTDYRDELAGINQGRQLLKINFTRLDGAMCIHCRTATVFDGYKFSRGTLMSPRFTCPNCGRTSDGCQTFEGFHAIYSACPTDLANEGLQFDCGVWTNGNWTIPQGPCPVCGHQYHPPAGQDLRL